MTEGFGNMKMMKKATLTSILFLMLSVSVMADDNEVYVDQSGASSTIKIEQINGSGNIIGGLQSTAGSLTPFDIDGSSMNLTLYQIGSSNIFLGDILGDNITFLYDADGDSNTMTIQVDPTDTFGANSGNYNIDITGNTNAMTLDVGTSALSDTLDLDWTLTGSGNTIDFDINYDSAVNFLDLDGDDNTVNFTGSGAANGYFYLDQTGDDRTFNIQQIDTSNNAYLKLISVGSNGTICIIQSDGSSSTGC